MAFPSGLRALDHAEYRRLFLTQLLSQIGSWIATVAQSWLVLQLTSSPLKLGLIGTLQFAPMLLFSIAMGAAADRLPKRRVLVTAQVAFLCQAVALALLVATGTAQYWHVCVLALLLGFANVVEQPVRHSFIVELVGPDDLANAIALNSASFNAARIVGPAAAGLLIARFGLAPAFALNALGFAAVITVLVRLRAHGLPGPRTGRSLFDEMGDGLRYAWSTPMVLVVFALITIVSLFVFNFTVYVPLLARTVLGLGPEGFGFLMASLGMGAVAGALTVGAVGPPSLAGIFSIAAICLGSLTALSAVRHFWTAAPLLFVTGFFGIMVMATGNARLQREAPGALRGRMMGLYVLLSSGVFPLGAFMVGAISERWGVSAAFLGGGVSGLLSLAVAGLLWRRRGER